MEIVKVQDAVGMALCHDITRIIKNESKGRAFKRGHIIREEDVPELLKLGKDHVYVWDLTKGWIHENDAAQRMATALAGEGITLTEPVEGKVELISQAHGLLKIDRERLIELNMMENIAVSTIHENQTITAGTTIAGTRIIPLVIEQAVVEEFERISNPPVIQVVPLRHWNVGMIVTGNEVYHGRIQDSFGPVVKKKLEDLGSSVMRTEFVPDDRDMTVEKIKKLIEDGAEMVVLTGGMSVDPDDLTPGSIRAAGGESVLYGTPVLPGSMFMLARIGNVPVMGLPGCVMYYRASIFDLVVPRVLAGETLTRRDIAELAHGGFCQKCKKCTYPNCGFGKG